ncbi:hypothetical protein [Parasphingopyxis marina]|uniref:Uncharacterized protein n=1 Tax=Parasphingopyxis marina TaxID=2761622 RepID=A0A842HR81_9SPHN|nr:hypothetical protein [Parasphingopyxis marina]MBC2776288.1 hypothetical protein [Parasphingopyxis marina]
MRFELVGKRRRVFGGSILTLVALEAGYVSRSRLDSFEIAGEPKLIYERAPIAQGQTLRWRTKTADMLEPGDIVGMDSLAHDPGPVGVEWQGTHLL